jgi:hypothetical protein
MSNWSVLLALQGFSWEAGAGRIGFAPRWRPADHRSFFSAGDAWGTFDQKRDGPAKQIDALAVKSGSLALRRVDLEVGPGVAPAGVAVSVDGAPVPGAALAAGPGPSVAVTLPAGTMVRAGQALRIELRTNS